MMERFSFIVVQESSSLKRGATDDASFTHAVNFINCDHI